MRTGKQINKPQPLAVGLRFVQGRLIIELDDEREVSLSLKRYPTLQKAKPSVRAQWTSIGPGTGFHWKDLDLDFAVRSIISGLPEVIPAPPRLQSQRGASVESLRKSETK